MNYDFPAINISFRKHLPHHEDVITNCRIKALDMSHLEQVSALHNSVPEELGHEIFALSDEEELRLGMTHGEGLSVGVLDEDKVVAVRNVIVSKRWSDETMEYYGFETHPDRRTAIIDFSVVHKSFRGNNMQQLMQYYIENLLSEEFDDVITTVSPKNYHSLKNNIACGFNIFELFHTYGGVLRFVLRKELKRDLKIHTGSHLKLNVLDLEEHTKALAEGYVGYKVVKEHSDIFVLYGKAEH